MSDPRSACWELALDCVAEADKFIKQTGSMGKKTADEIPAPVALYMQRAQVFATLASVPTDVVLAGALEEQIRLMHKKQAHERAQRIMEQHNLAQRKHFGGQ